jgi:L-threonylcarbamoyladenylate synthase
METAGVPVAAPSANRFSRPSPTRAAHVIEDLGGRVDLVLDGGPTPIGVESTIVDCTVTPPVLRRPGGITREQLLALVPDLVVEDRFGEAHRAQPAPGQMLKHYAPRARVTLYEGAPDAVVERVSLDARQLAGQGSRVGILAPEEEVLALAPRRAALASSGRVMARAFGPRRDPGQAARLLFDTMRALDAEGPDVMLAIGVGHEAIGAAIRDRLLRAAEGRVIRV